MNWQEYGDYIQETTDYTCNQAYAIAGGMYGVEDDTIALELETTMDTIRVQKSRLEFGSLREEKVPEFFKTPVPNVPFKLVGELDYFYSEHWSKESNSGNVRVYFSAKESDEYVAVIEKYSKAKETDLMNPDENGVVAVVDEVKRTTIYESADSFMNNSVHSPNQLPSDTPDIEMDKNGLLYSESN